MKTLQELLALKQRNAERLMALMAILEGSTSVAARSLTDVRIDLWYSTSF